MKVLFLTISFLAILTSCDVQSGMTKKSVEKYLPTPTPSISPTPTEMPIDPAEVVTVDTSLTGDDISIYRSRDKTSAACTKFNEVEINSSDSTITIKGACKQIMVNGHRNKITADAAAEIVINGDGNEVTYSRYVNGKRPVIKENREGSTVEKVELLQKPARQ